MFKRIIYRQALDLCIKSKGPLDGSAGTEHIARNALADALGGKEKGVKIEQPLISLGGTQPTGERNGKVDIVIFDKQERPRHGIELKVIRMPRLKSVSPMSSLYDLGQITRDFARLNSASKLESGELVLLLVGPFIDHLKSDTAVLRELHNRLYVDYSTALEFGELRPSEIGRLPKSDRDQRAKQLQAVEALGFDRPYGSGDQRGARASVCVVRGDLAMASIPVK